MLTDIALRNLKPKSKLYKVSDRDGMYVTVSPAGKVVHGCVQDRWWHWCTEKSPYQCTTAQEC